jgi:60 kDa SS-A/Ro ribonucleoprotein
MFVAKANKPLSLQERKECIMANKNLFQSSAGMAPITDALNEAGGVAYNLSDKAALAQMVVTGCFNQTFYADAKTQLDTVLKLANKVPTKFVAQLAVYARTNAYMKDSPAVLAAVLASRDMGMLKSIFATVIDNGKMVRNFCQILRSGVVGRKSFGTAAKKLVQNWLINRKPEQLFRDIVGNDPSLSDVIKMTHPHPKNKTQEFMFAYICGRVNIEVKGNTLTATKVYNGKTQTIKSENIPDIVRDFEIFKAKKLAGKSAGETPDVPFQMLSSLNMGTAEWTEMARNGSWTFTRMNLNNFLKYDVFKDKKMVDMIADRLSSSTEVKKSRVFPYQLLTAFKSVSSEMPTKITNALQDAMEIAVGNIPDLDGKKIYVCVDTSGSMQSAVTGDRGGGTTATTCVDVAGLVASAILRKNQDTSVIPFDTDVHLVSLNSRDSVMTNAQKLALRGGGTDCSCALRYLNNIEAKGDVVIFVSDNESWADRGYGRGTGTHNEFLKFRKRNPNAVLINIDIQPNTYTQTKESPYIFNIGGFSDQVFEIIAAIAKDRLNKDWFVTEIEKVKIG